MKLTFAKDEETQTIEELWISLAKLSANIVEDNKHSNYSGEYPIWVRQIQLVGITALVKCIEETHAKEQQ